MRKYRGRLVMLVTLAALMWGCDNAVSPVYLGPNDPDALKGKRWEWVGYTSFKKGYSDLIPGKCYFTVDSLGKISGLSGCTPLTGNCDLSTSEIRFDSIGYLLSECPKPDFGVSFIRSATYKQRDSCLLVIPTTGEYMHLFFRAR